MTKIKSSPLYVEVDEFEYNMYGTPTRRNKQLAKILKRIGGVNHAVPAGTYIFDVKFDWKRFQFCASLKEA